MDFQTVGELRRSLMDARARASQRGRQHCSAAFPCLEAWILSKPVSASGSGPASEISSQAGEGDFEDNILVSTPNQQVKQVLVVQAQNGVNMGSCMATTAPSTAPPQLAGPSTMEPIVPIDVQLVAQDTPSVIQEAKPGVSNEQTMQSTQRYGTLPYVPGPPYTAPLPYAVYTAPLPYAAMPSMSTRPTLIMGYYGQSTFPFVPNPNWMTEREQMLQQQQLLQQQLLQERQQFEAALRARSSPA